MSQEVASRVVQGLFWNLGASAGFTKASLEKRLELAELDEVLHYVSSSFQLWPGTNHIMLDIVFRQVKQY